MIILTLLESASWTSYQCQLNFFARYYTAEVLRAIICSKSTISIQRQPVDPNFRVEGIAPTNHSFSQKTRINDLSYGIQISTYLSSVLSQCTPLIDRETDGQTDRILIARPRLHSMQRGRNTVLTPDKVLNVLTYGLLRCDQIQQAYVGERVKWS